MVKRSVVLVAGLVWLAAAVVSAHELKVLADRFQVPAGEQAKVFLSWGHSLTDDSPVDAQTLERFDVVSPGGTSARLKTGGLSVQSNQVLLREPGVYQVAASRQPAVLTYVHDEFGNRMMRRGPKSSVTDGEIDYAQRSQHSAKALLVAGAPTAAAIEPVGLPLEIVPLDGPTAWRAGNAVRFRVLFRGQPVAGEQVLATHAGFDEDAWCFATNTDAEGVATVRPHEAGTWVLLVNLRKLTRGPTREQYDFESSTTTLTMGIGS
jgi:uncharacterized GH25 family protein